MPDTDPLAALQIRAEQEIVPALNHALQEVFDLAARRRSWTMTIPVQPTDSDSVLADAVGAAKDFIAELLADLARCQQENDALKAQFRSAGIVPYLDRMKELAARHEAAEQRVTILEQALRRYGLHDKECMVEAAKAGDSKCRCGLEAALARPVGEPDARS